MEVEDGDLMCAHGHLFSIHDGVPRLTPEAERGAARAIRGTFSRQWEHFDYEDDRTWAQDVAQRCELFLKEIESSPDELAGKLVLDAGCGNGTLSQGITAFGCEVLAADISDGVAAAYEYFDAMGNGRTHFVQADLMRHPFRDGRFDVVYSSGVLHHTPSTRAALEAVFRALAPGGTLYIWVYWRVPGRRNRFNETIRRAVAPLPAPLKHGLVQAWLLPALGLRRVRKVLGRSRPYDELNRRETLVLLLDRFTPRYRWVHTPEDVHGWYRELGLADIVTTEEREWGFGVAARRPEG
jgi:SAM-dependent methyltransferase